MVRLRLALTATVCLSALCFAACASSPQLEAERGVGGNSDAGTARNDGKCARLYKKYGPALLSQLFRPHTGGGASMCERLQHCRRVLSDHRESHRRSRNLRASRRKGARGGTVPLKLGRLDGQTELLYLSSTTGEYVSEYADGTVAEPVPAASAVDTTLEDTPETVPKPEVPKPVVPAGDLVVEPDPPPVPAAPVVSAVGKDDLVKWLKHTCKVGKIAGATAGQCQQLGSELADEENKEKEIELMMKAAKMKSTQEQKVAEEKAEEAAKKAKKAAEAAAKKAAAAAAKAGGAAANVTVVASPPPPATGNGTNTTAADTKPVNATIPAPKPVVIKPPVDRHPQFKHAFLSQAVEQAKLYSMTVHGSYANLHTRETEGAMAGALVEFLQLPAHYVAVGEASIQTSSDHGENVLMELLVPNEAGAAFAGSATNGLLLKLLKKCCGVSSVVSITGGKVDAGHFFQIVKRPAVETTEANFQAAGYEGKLSVTKPKACGCGAHGECVAGGCHCDPKYIVVAGVCTLKTKPTLCGQTLPKKECMYGDCFKGIQCECFPGYTGDDCKIKTTCARNCTDHGSCEWGKCWCDAGWGGDDCATDTSCASSCNRDHGRCHRGSCYCENGYTGDDCDVGPVSESEMELWRKLRALGAGFIVALSFFMFLIGLAVAVAIYLLVILWYRRDTIMASTGGLGQTALKDGKDGKVKPYRSEVWRRRQQP